MQFFPNHCLILCLVQSKESRSYGRFCEILMLTAPILFAIYVYIIMKHNDVLFFLTKVMRI